MIFTLDKTIRLVRIKFADEAEMRLENDERIGIRVGDLLRSEEVSGPLVVTLEIGEPDVCPDGIIAICVMELGRSLRWLWKVTDDHGTPPADILRSALEALT